MRHSPIGRAMALTCSFSLVSPDATGRWPERSCKSCTRIVCAPDNAREGVRSRRRRRKNAVAVERGPVAGLAAVERRGPGRLGRRAVRVVRRQARASARWSARASAWARAWARGPPCGAAPWSCAKATTRGAGSTSGCRTHPLGRRGQLPRPLSASALGSRSACWSGSSCWSRSSWPSLSAAQWSSYCRRGQSAPGRERERQQDTGDEPHIRGDGRPGDEVAARGRPFPTWGGPAAVQRLLDE